MHALQPGEQGLLGSSFVPETPHSCPADAPPYARALVLIAGLVSPSIAAGHSDGGAATLRARVLKVSAAEIQAAGPLTRQAIAGQLNRHLEAFRGCHQGGDARFAENVLLSWTIDPDGAVSAGSHVGSDLGTCALGVLKGLRFAQSPAGSTEVQNSLTFTTIGEWRTDPVVVETRRRVDAIEAGLGATDAGAGAPETSCRLFVERDHDYAVLTHASRAEDGSDFGGRVHLKFEERTWGDADVDVVSWRDLWGYRVADELLFLFEKTAEGTGIMPLKREHRVYYHRQRPYLWVSRESPVAAETWLEAAIKDPGTSQLPPRFENWAALESEWAPFRGTDAGLCGQLRAAFDGLSATGLSQAARARLKKRFPGLIVIR